MKNKKEAVDMLCESSEKLGLVETIHTVLGNNVKVSIPFSKLAVDTPIDELDFSVGKSE